MKKFILPLLSASLLVVFCPPSFARTISPAISPFNGFFAGIEAGRVMANINRHTTVSTVEQASSAETNYNLNITQNGAAAGFELGYGRTFKNQSYFGILLNAFDNFGNEASKVSTTTFTDAGDKEYTPELFLKMGYNVNLILTPGFLVNKNWLAYAMIGAAYSHVYLKEQYHYMPEESNQASMQFSPATDAFGAIFGIGTKYHFAKYVNIFAEYGYTVYQKISLGRHVEPVPGDQDIFRARNNYLNTQTVMFGVDSYFD